MARNPAIDNLLSSFARGEKTNAAGAALGAAELAKRIMAASTDESAASILTLQNAVIDGHLVLDLIGDPGRPISLSLINCRINGQFRARTSNWRRLVIATTHVEAVDIPASHFAGELILEQVTALGWLEARGVQVGGIMSLGGSVFRKADRAVAVELGDARIGGRLSASKLRAEGGLSATGAQVGGDLQLSGAVLLGDASRPALNIQSAKIAGDLNAGLVDQQAFCAKGRLIAARASLGSLSITAGDLDGLGEPALVGDQLRVDHGVNLGGVPGDALRRFVCKGAIRLLGMKAGGQVQVYNAELAGGGGQHTLNLDGSVIDGDVVIGGDAGAISSDGDLSMIGASISGRVFVTNCDVTGRKAALWLREASIAGGVTIGSLKCSGSLQLEGLNAGSLIVYEVELRRIRDKPDLSGRAENYAHEDDALLDMHGAVIKGDARFDGVELTGGDFRLMGAAIGGHLTVTAVAVRDCGALAIIAQNLQALGGAMVAGAPERPCVLEGDLVLIGAQIKGGLTLLHLEVGSAESPRKLVVSDSVIDGSLLIAESRLFGGFNADAARVSHDLRLETVELRSPGEAVVLARAATVSGRLVLTDDSEPRGIVDGTIWLMGCELGELMWENLRLADGAGLAVTNTEITGALRAKALLPEGAGRVDLSGSSAALLDDWLGDQQDSWGAGKLGLVIDNFYFGRLERAAGVNSEHPYWIRHWRAKWLARRIDKSSTQAARRLATSLRQQGHAEAARLVMIDAFAAEGQQRVRPAERWISALFGLTYGHGFSGWRALFTIIVIWMVGSFGVITLNAQGLLALGEGVVAIGGAEKPKRCGEAIDPMLYAADVMLPVLDLGQEKLCVIAPTKGTRLTPYRDQTIVLGATLNRYGDWALARFLGALYAVVGWVALSLAVATWAGVFRRSGRD